MIVVISHASKVMLQILQASLQQYVNGELPDIRARCGKGRGTRVRIANIHWVTQKAKEFLENIYFCFIDHAKAFDYVDCKMLSKILKEMGIPDHLTCLMRNLYVGQEATVRTRYEQWTGSKLGKEYVKAVYCNPAYLSYMHSSVQSLSPVFLFATP